MGQLTIDYPESFVTTSYHSHADFQREARTALAMKLYELGRLTSGQAASLAGIPRVAFLLACKSYGTHTVKWNDEEIDAEFQS
ncbi:MAG: UPF0175 family protein [Polyangia bacterium]